MFGQLVNETASRLNLPVTEVSALIQSLLPMLISNDTGGVHGFLELFRQAGLQDVVKSWSTPGTTPAVITEAQIEAALGPRTLEMLAGASGMSRPAVLTALTVVLPRIIRRLTTDLRLTAPPDVRHIPANDVAATVIEPDGFSIGSGQQQAWLPWAVAAVAIVAAFLWWRSPAVIVEPQLRIQNQDGQILYSGAVRDSRTQKAIVNALHETFGADNVHGQLLVDRKVRQCAWLPYVNEFLAALRTPGVDVSLIGEAVSVGGWITGSDRELVSTQMRDIFGTHTAIRWLGDAADDAARVANAKAVAALKAVGTSGKTTEQVIQAMNLAVINFPSGSAEIPTDARDIIQKSAEAIRYAQPGSLIEIEGHTDNTGDTAHNLLLSQERAEAVRRALVRAGAPNDILVARGYGDARPRASNSTEYRPLPESAHRVCGDWGLCRSDSLSGVKEGESVVQAA